MKNLNEFACKLQNMISDDKDNVFISPHSIQMALAICASGAYGETLKEMKSTLCIDENLQDYLKKLNEIIKSEKTQLSAANALWVSQDYNLNDNFVKIVVNIGSKISNMEFHDNTGSAKTINDWVESKTNNLIKDLISPAAIDPDTKLIITNAIYFKGNWANKFNKNHTVDMKFNGINKSEKVPMMHINRKFDVHKDDHFTSVIIPYEDESLSMIAMLPHKNLESVRNLINHEYIENICDQSRMRKVLLDLPKFKMETELSLVKTLQDLGMNLAFTNLADFRNIGDKPIYISDVVHKAFVEVNEEGTEAAAATGVIFATCCVSMPEEPLAIKFDKPFYFAIMQKNSILFSGYVMDI